jgi:hypothetical protein
MFHNLWLDAIEFQNKVERETTNRDLISKAKKIRNSLHAAQLEKALKLLKEWHILEI